MRDEIANWRKSSRSRTHNGNCVEAGSTRGRVAVRDTKQHGRGPTLRFSKSAWGAFLANVTRDEITW